MSNFSQAITLLNQVDAQRSAEIKTLRKKIKKLEEELSQPRKVDNRVQHQGKIIGEQAAEIRKLKAANKTQEARLRQAKEALR